MEIETNSSDKAILHELGERIARHRLNKNITQQTLAQESGVSLPTIQRMERGESTNITNIIRVLRVLKLLENLELVIPDLPLSPIIQVTTNKKTRQRASSKQQKDNTKQSKWSWGDE